LAQAAAGVDVVHVAARDGIVHAEDYGDAIDERTGLVSVPLISYRNGMRLPTAEVIAMARAMSIKTVVDAYQGAGVEPIDVRELGCDYLISGTLKYMLGLPGLAFLYVRAGLVDAVSPIQTGWFGRVNPYEFDPHKVDFPPHARRFESGTPSIPSAFGAVAGMRMLNTLDGKDVAAHIAELGEHLDDSLRMAGERIASPADSKLRGPMVAVLDDDPAKLAAYLGSQHIDTSPRGNAVRLSLHFYNTASDVAAVEEAIRRYRRI
jgi:selenocysteine lyase/cysteine desulfurase